MKYTITLVQAPENAGNTSTEVYKRKFELNRPTALASLITKIDRETSNSIHAEATDIKDACRAIEYKAECDEADAAKTVAKLWSETLQTGDTLATSPELRDALTLLSRKAKE